MSPHCAPIGTVFEVPVGVGAFAYGQVTHYHPDFGNVVAIFAGIRSVRPTDWVSVLGDIQFMTFFVVKAAAKRKFITILGECPVPMFLRTFPKFKVPVRDFRRGEVDHWLLWDGSVTTRMAGLSREQANLPTRTSPSFPLLQDWIREGRTNAEIL